MWQLATRPCSIEVEAREADHIAGGVDVRNGGLEAIVDSELAPRAGF